MPTTARGTANVWSDRASVGVGLAVPASTVEFVANALEHGGVVPHSYLGVSVQPVTPNMAESIGLKSASGVIVLVGRFI